MCSVATMSESLSVSLSGRVFAAQVSPWPSPPTLLALGLGSSVSILQLVLPEEQEEADAKQRKFGAFRIREVREQINVYIQVICPFSTLV